MAKSKNMNPKGISEKGIGKMMILEAIKLEESMVDLLRVETRLLKRHLIKDYSRADIIKFNKIMKYLMFSIMILDERIRAGIELIEKDTKSDNPPK